MGQGVRMAREIPELVRAAAGLAATVLDEARKLPETLPGLPVRLIGLALQRAMRIQQQYAGLVARGDELFTGIRGEDEPGLATFDDDEPESGAPPGGFRESAFDRVDDLPLDDGHSEDELIEVALLEAELAADPAVEAIVDEVELAAVVVEDARETVAVLAEEAPDTETLLEEVLDEIAIDDLVADAPEAALPVEAALPAKATAKKAAARKKATAEKPAASAAPAKKTAKKAAKKAAPSTPALVPEAAPTLAPRGPAPAPAPSAPETPATPAPAAAEAPAPEASPAFTQTSLSAPATAPIDGYDFFSVAQLRGHLRGYAAPTVEQLLSYEKAGLAREPYLRMLRNRLERLRSESA
ncbi:MAG: hypothetical protein QOJ68_1268 [Blastococcus sp.]|nr:hypothetical protein [Blastococcus sp.]